MSSGNRTVKYENLLKALRKHYKPLAEPPERSVLEHLLYACCLEDARVEQADEGFAKLQQTYFDWNEVRVTTVVELAEALKPLPFPMQAASRIKQCLQSIFETRYQYDIDDMKKANLGKATAELEGWKGNSPFVVAYVSQHALGGHSIPASNLICEAMWQCDVLTIAEIPKKALPGIERAIPKNKGIEFAGLMHQFASDLYHHPKSATPAAVLKDMGASYKSKPAPAEAPSASKAKGPATKSTPIKEADKKKGAQAPSPTKANAPTVETTKVEPTVTSNTKGKEDTKPQKVSVSVKPMGTDRLASKETTAKSAAPSKSDKSDKTDKTEKAVKHEKSVKADKVLGGKPPATKPPATKPIEQTKAFVSTSKPPVKATVKPTAKPTEKPTEKPTVKPTVKPTASKSDKNAKPTMDKSKADKSKADKSKADKIKADKSKPEKSKPTKKDSNEAGKGGKAPVKGNHGTTSTSLTKKKPR